jgi:hypothetical protein
MNIEYRKLLETDKKIGKERWTKDIKRHFTEKEKYH